ncbi:hypothetical protein [Pedobacter ureilyticus]|uniref:Uncharacterized protein n=1 Tax=Pedobacter ureilyticus TaxID=1393051 RepID=A0ABW9J0T8_9SPHI|nr:hypothetical protein [Pedobacter helvus]
MDIVKHLKKHTEQIHSQLLNTSVEERMLLKTITLRFYFLLPDFDNIVRKCLKINIDKDQLVSDIIDGHLEKYQKPVKKSNAEIDEYADDFEEAEQMEIFILDAIDNATSSVADLPSLERLFLGIIDVLDYYENFSDQPEYWNGLLDKELPFQIEFLNSIKSPENVDSFSYQKRYEDVDFSEV